VDDESNDSARRLSSIGDKGLYFAFIVAQFDNAAALVLLQRLSCSRIMGTQLQDVRCAASADHCRGESRGHCRQKGPAEAHIRVFLPSSTSEAWCYAPYSTSRFDISTKALVGVMPREVVSCRVGVPSQVDKNNSRVFQVGTVSIG
jgi:hypothetical protein